MSVPVLKILANLLDDLSKYFVFPLEIPYWEKTNHNYYAIQFT